eukprot:9492752-Pyramimonas_sp.AAC.1
MPKSVATLSILTSKPSLAKPRFNSLPSPALLVTIVDFADITKPASEQPFAKVKPACKANPRTLLYRPSTL